MSVSRCYNAELSVIVEESLVVLWLVVYRGVDKGRGPEYPALLSVLRFC